MISFDLAFFPGLFSIELKDNKVKEDKKFEFSIVSMIYVSYGKLQFYQTSQRIIQKITQKNKYKKV